MKTVSCLLLLSTVLAIIIATNAVIDEKFRKDMFNIYTNVAIDVKDVKGTPVYPENVTYYLYTEENPGDYVTIDRNHPTQIKNKNVKYVFLIHGWTSNREAEWYGDLKDAFLARNDYDFNVIQVDWRGPANEIYAISSINTKDVGNIVGDFIVKLHKENGIPLENIWLVGHSLGGQVSGFAAKKVIKETGKKLPRVIALDPAGPLFVSRPEDEKLNQNDAEVVSVLHTDGGKFGYEAPIGTIDFFPNGGSDQPGCTKIDLLDISSVADPIWCDHQRSWAFYIEALLNPDKFVAKQCVQQTKLLIIKSKQCDDSDTVTLGDLETTKRGTYYLETNSEKPYGKKTSNFDISKLIPHV